MDSAILAILVKHKLAPSIELLAAMQDVFQAGAASVQPGTPTPGDDDEDDSSATLSAADITSLKALGVDPAKKFRLRNSVFTIVAYKPSRWKFPIVAQNQNGTRYKFKVPNVKTYQT